VRRVLIVICAAAALAVAAGWYVTTRWTRPAASSIPATAPPSATASEQPARKIRATLFYVSEDGSHLVSMSREVPFAETTAEQARRIVEEQLKPAPSPYAAPLPAGTTVRAVFLTDHGDAFVDLGSEITQAHSGGSLDELFSVYAIVNALTANLPAVTRVQILIGGHEVDSLAGHVDLRRPLPPNMSLVVKPPDGPIAAPSGPAPSASPEPESLPAPGRTPAPPAPRSSAPPATPPHL
jgi:hypothetical protein